MPISNKHSKNYVWWTERDRLALATTSDGINFSSPKSNDEVRVYAIKQGNHFKTGVAIDLTEESDIPNEFHEALIAKVHQYLYSEKPQDLTLAQYHKAIYDEYVKKGKQYGNESRIASDMYPIKPYDY